MADFQAIADRVEIDALRGEFTDAAMMCDYDRAASLFTTDGALRMPHANVDLTGREAIRAFGPRREEMVDYYAIYHDRYRRTDDGWKFAERVYEIRYLDTSPLAGSPPSPAESGH